MRAGGGWGKVEIEFHFAGSGFRGVGELEELPAEGSDCCGGFEGHGCDLCV